MSASEKKLSLVVKEIYQQMYDEAQPMGDLQRIASSGEGKEPNWFMKYYLPLSRQIEIIEETCKKHKLTKRDSQKVSATIHLGYAPRGD